MFTLCLAVDNAYYCVEHCMSPPSPPPLIHNDLSTDVKGEMTVQNILRGEFLRCNLKNCFINIYSLNVRVRFFYLTANKIN